MASADLSQPSSATRSRATLGRPSAIRPVGQNTSDLGLDHLRNIGFPCGGARGGESLGQPPSRQALEREAAAAGPTGRRLPPSQRTYHGQAGHPPMDSWITPAAGNAHPIEFSRYYQGEGRNRSGTQVSRGTVSNVSMVVDPHPSGRDRTQSWRAGAGGGRSLEDFDVPPSNRQRRQVARPLPSDAYVSHDPIGVDQRYRRPSQGQVSVDSRSSLSSTSSRDLAGELVNRMTRPIGQFFRNMTNRVLRRPSAHPDPQQPVRLQEGQGDDTMVWPQPRQ